MRCIGLVSFVVLFIFSQSSMALSGARSLRKRFYVFSTDTTITSSNVGQFKYKHWIVKTGVTITIDQNTTIPIQSLVLQGTAIITHTQCLANPCASIGLDIAGDATVPVNAKITANGKGYLGSYTGSNGTIYGVTNGLTTTGGALRNAGGSHAGYGGYYTTVPTAIPGAPYGVLEQPTSYGSGGGGQSASHRGGSGGGVIYLKIGGTLSLDGEINAGGEDVNGYQATGAGAGGSIWVDAKTITSTSNTFVIVAWGGDNTTLGAHGSGGGGGRIAIYYQTFAGTMALDMIHVRAEGGQGDNAFNLGGPGIVYAKQSAATYGTVYIVNPWGNDSFYQETVFPQDSNRTLASIVMVGSKARMLSTNNVVTSSATTLSGNGALASKFWLPTNGSAGYGSWFVPGSTTLNNSSTITEY